MGKRQIYAKRETIHKTIQKQRIHTIEKILNYVLIYSMQQSPS
jgi:hypothetical protein